LILAAWLAASSPALAADHIDSPGAIADPTADLTDVFAWMNADASKINLILTVAPFDSSDTFSDATTYAFHIESTSEYGVAGTSSVVTCEFYNDVNIECWAPNDTYVTGDASDPAGIANADSSIKVFAGPRNDPFFFESVGFNNAVAAVIGVGVVPDGTCPPVDGPTSGALLDALTAGGNPVDTFAGATVQALVVQIDRDLVDEGGPILAISGATYVKN